MQVQISINNLAGKNTDFSSQLDEACSHFNLKAHVTHRHGAFSYGKELFITTAKATLTSETF